MTTTQPVIHCDPDIMGGVPVFVGTRVPVKTLWDHLRTGDSIEVFLGDFPSVTRDQAIATLDCASMLLAKSVTPDGFISKDEFYLTAEYLLGKNAELYRRLA